MTQVQKKRADRGAWLSIISYIFLAILKLTVGWTAGSKVLVADGLNNTTDFIASVAILIGLKLARKPPDENHPYGHRRIETIASLVASFIMLTVGLQVFYQAVRSFFQPTIQPPDVIAAYLSLFCACVMYIVYQYNKQLATQVQSHALHAAAKDNLTDAWVSIGTMFAVLATQFGLPWLDPLAAVVISIMILKTAWNIFTDSTHMLTDGIDQTSLSCLAELIQKVPGVKHVKDVKARLHGNSLLVDVTISVDRFLTVEESHRITEKMEKKIKKEFTIKHIQVHVEP